MSGNNSKLILTGDFPAGDFRSFRVRPVEIRPDGKLELLLGNVVYCGVVDLPSVFRFSRNLLSSASRDEYHAMVVAVPGRIIALGTVKECASYPFLEKAILASAIREQFNLPGLVVNSMEAAASGMHYMAGEPEETVLAVNWDDSLEARILRNGEPLSYGTEAGHMVVDLNPLGQICSDGKRGHFEAIIGGQAIASQVYQLSAWQNLSEDEQYTAKTPLCYLIDAYSWQQEWAIRTCQGIASHMGAFLHNLLHLFPETAAVLWKGAVAHQVLRFEPMEKLIRQTMRLYARLEETADTPFQLIPETNVLPLGNCLPGAPGDDIFYGCAIAARKHLCL